jgi:hypothetical protein
VTNLSSNGNTGSDSAARIALSDDGTKATAVWPWYNGTNDIIQTASTTITGSPPAWGTVTVTDLSATGRNAKNPQIALSSDGTKATAVWQRNNGTNDIIQTASTTISGTPEAWGAVNVTDLSATGGSASYAQIALSSDGTKATAVWTRNNGTNDIIQTASTTISGTPVAWGTVTVTNLSATSADADSAQVALSSDGTRATAVWQWFGGQDYIIQTASTTISGTPEGWGAVNVTDLSAYSAGEGEYPQVALSSDGTVAVTAWQWTDNSTSTDVIQASSALITYLPPPTITGIFPPSGFTTGGRDITIFGTDLSNATSITVGGNACTSFTVWTDGFAVCTTPAAGSAGTAPVVVTTAGGSNAGNTLFTYVEPTTPNILNPTGGASTSDGLRIYTENARFQIVRNGQKQIYQEDDPDDPNIILPAYLNFSLYADDARFVGAYPPSLVPGGYQWSNYSGPKPSIAWIPTSNTLTDLGNGAWRNIEVLTATYNSRTYGMTVTTDYQAPRAFAEVTIDINVPAGLNAPPQLYITSDFYLDGDDDGPGATGIVGGRRYVVQNGSTALGGILEFGGTDNSFDSYFEGNYQYTYGEPSCDGPCNGTVYDNSVNPSPNTDAGVAAQWALTTTSGLQTRKVMLYFGSSDTFPAYVPGAPATISATAGNAQATVSWTAPTSDGGAPVSGYQVQYSTTAGGSYIDAQGGCAPATTGSSTALTCTASGLTNGTTYYFKVAAINSAGPGSYTSPASVTPTAATVPGAPATISATPGNAQAIVSWTAPTSDGGAAVSGYQVQYSSSTGGSYIDAQGGCAPATTGSSTALTCTASGLTNGTTYYFKVAAINSAGTGTYTSPASATPVTVPGAPTSVSATAGNAQATVTWTAPSNTGGSAITGYSVTGAPGGSCTTTGATSCVVTGLTNGTAYTFQVAAINAQGTGTASTASSSITPLGVPDAPTSVSATAGNSQAVVTFTAPTNTGGSTITGYAASCTSSNGGAAGTVTGSGSPLTVTGLTNGKTYTCEVTADNAQGTGTASTASSSITPLGVPDAPTSVSATAGNAQATVTWTAPSNTGGSAITGYSVTGAPGGSCTTTGATSCVVTGLTNGTAYTFQVVATNAQGDGTASTASNSVTPQGEPDAPTSVSATAGNAQATVTWTAPSNTGGSAITGYSVTGAPGGSCTTTGATSCVVTGLTNGTAYTFQVVATNAQGTGAAASSNTVTPEAALAPAIFAVSPSTGPQAGGTAVTITGSNLTGASQVLFGQTPATSVTVNSANQITAVSPAHAGGAVDITVVTPAGQDVLELSYTYDAPPAVPGTPIPAAGDRQVNVSWPQVLTGGGDPVSYTVTASPGGQTCSVPFPGQAYPYASCVVTGLTNGTAYTFRVQATNALGNATSGSSVPATPQAMLNGACGAANGVATLVPPAGLLCGTGTASAVSNSNGTFNWSCTGTNGGSTAQCDAPGAASQGSQTGSTAFTTDSATSGCNLNSARLITPPEGGPGGSTTMPYGVVNFEMVSCTGNEARVRMTYAGIVEGMQFWKYVVNSYHTGWTQMPSSEVTLSGNTAEFTIVDNGEWDNDPTVGAIADPGGPGYDPNALVAPGQPVNVTATAGNQSATVNWQAPASGGQPVRYVVAALINGTPTGQTCEATWPATGCTVTGLTNGTAYTFTVSAENGAGNGQAAAVITPVTPRPNPVPPPNPIPTLGPVGLVGLSSLLPLVAGWRQRRKPRPSSALRG